MENVKCPICKCSFLPETLGQKKCITCEKCYPDASSLEELQNKDQANKDVSKMFSENKLRSIVLSILDELGLNLKVCNKCGKPFIPHSPAQKSCPACKGKSKETKKQDIIPDEGDKTNELDGIKGTDNE